MTEHPILEIELRNKVMYRLVHELHSERRQGDKPPAPKQKSSALLLFGDARATIVQGARDLSCGGVTR